MDRDLGCIYIDCIFTDENLFSVLYFLPGVTKYTSVRVLALTLLIEMAKHGQSLDFCLPLADSKVIVHRGCCTSGC